MVYTDEKSNYILLVNISSIIDSDIELIDCRKEQNKLQINAREMLGIEKIRQGYMVVIPTKLPAGSEVEYINCYTSKELDTMKMMSNMNEGSGVYTMSFKPIIYLYPDVERDISVKLGYKDNITVSYPKYNDGWSVKAKPDGTLIEHGTSRELYALYYENLNAIDFNIQKDGFVVLSDDIVPFLEEKLEILGLNSKEIQEFIIYWLPVLEKNKYNYIRFATKEERELGKVNEIIKEEILIATENLTSEEKDSLIVAYEPIWSIGTGLIPTNEEIAEVFKLINSLIPTTKVLYGGSANEKNIDELKQCSLIEGYLLGGLSLKPENLKVFIEKLEN